MADTPSEHVTSRPLSEPPTITEYEQLKGKVGRHALYRPDRFMLRELVDRPDQFLLTVAGQAVLPRNFSLSGLSFRDPQKRQWTVGQVVPYSVQLGETLVLEGESTVVRSEEKRRYVEVGITSTSVLDYEALRAAEREHDWQEALRREQNIFKDPLPSEYRQAVLELAGFCQFYKNQLGRREMQHPGDPRAIAEEAFPGMQRGWTELSSRAAAAAVDFLDDTETLREARLVSEHLVTPYLVEAPVLRRAYEKPLGYPGDYVVMQHYFDNTFDGDTAFGMVFHKITNEHPLSAGVRTRSERVAGEIADRARSSNGSGPLRVLSLGSGVGAEVAMVHGSAAAPVRWTLIDQEDQALAVAYRNARKLPSEMGALPEVRCVNVSFSQLFRGEVSPDAWGEQDVIFALGMFDYLPDAGAAMLIAALYSRLRAGGSLYVGNAAKPNTHFWEPELALRWSLRYRDREEMEALGVALPCAARTKLGMEPAGAYHILECRKP